MHEKNPAAKPYGRSSGGTENSVRYHVPCHEAVGCLVYLMMAAYPHIAFAVSPAAPAMDQTTEAEWIDVECILKYLRGTNNYGLLYGAGNSKGTLKAFRNANSADDVSTRRPTSVIVAVHAGSAVAWSSQLRLVEMSTEAEFIAASQGVKELLWLKCLLGELCGKM